MGLPYSGTLGTPLVGILPDVTYQNPIWFLNSETLVQSYKWRQESPKFNQAPEPKYTNTSALVVTTKSCIKLKSIIWLEAVVTEGLPGDVKWFNLLHASLAEGEGTSRGFSEYTATGSGDTSWQLLVRIATRLCAEYHSSHGCPLR